MAAAALVGVVAIMVVPLLLLARAAAPHALPDDKDIDVIVGSTDRIGV